MSVQTSQSNITARRAELLAELFFEELRPVFVSRPTTPDVGYELLVGFPNEKAGINTFAVNVRATERPVGPRFPIARATFNRIVHSNVPGLLLVADVKQNRLYYGWLGSKDSKNGGDTVSIRLVEINETTKGELQRQFQGADDRVAAMG